VPAIPVAAFRSRENPLSALSRWRIWPRERASAAVAWMHRVHCGLTGHAMMLQIESARLSLRCHGCGEETPGWSIG